MYNVRSAPYYSVLYDSSVEMKMLCFYLKKILSVNVRHDICIILTIIYLYGTKVRYMVRASINAFILYILYICMQMLPICRQG